MDEIEEIRKKKLEKLMKMSTMPDHPVYVNDSTIDGELAKNEYVVLDMYADWCNPCKMMEPVLETLAKKHHGKIVFLKINVDENPLTSRKYNVMSIPTFLLFRRGELVGRITGAMPAHMFEKRMLEQLGLHD